MPTRKTALEADAMLMLRTCSRPSVCRAVSPSRTNWTFRNILCARALSEETRTHKIVTAKAQNIYSRCMRAGCCGGSKGLKTEALTMLYSTGLRSVAQLHVSYVWECTLCSATRQLRMGMYTVLSYTSVTYGNVHCAQLHVSYTWECTLCSATRQLHMGMYTVLSYTSVTGFCENKKENSGFIEAGENTSISMKTSFSRGALLLTDIGSNLREQ
jgi:hypothetical protein